MDFKLRTLMGPLKETLQNKTCILQTNFHKVYRLCVTKRSAQFAIVKLKKKILTKYICYGKDRAMAFELFYNIIDKKRRYLVFIIPLILVVYFCRVNLLTKLPTKIQSGATVNILPIRTASAFTSWFIGEPEPECSKLSNLKYN